MSTFILRVRERFEAAHNLHSYRGVPEPVHGHSWVVEVVLSTEELDSEGMGFDFVEIKKTLAGLASRFHHQHINTIPPFDKLTPTTEHMARWFHERLEAAFPSAQVDEVTLWEGPDCSATFRPP